MRSVGLKVLKNKLSEYVRLAEKGETVLVTDRGRTVAELVPPQASRNKLSDEELIARGAHEGWLTPAKNPGNGSVASKTGDEIRGIDARARSGSRRS